MAIRGAQVYAANGCVYCHSQQVRPDYGGSDLERKWGERRSAPRDYIFEPIVFLGRMRTGPDLANVGHRPALQEAGAATPAPAPAAGALQQREHRQRPRPRRARQQRPVRLQLRSTAAASSPAGTRLHRGDRCRHLPPATSPVPASRESTARRCGHSLRRQWSRIRTS